MIVDTTSLEVSIGKCYNRPGRGASRGDPWFQKRSLGTTQRDLDKYKMDILTYFVNKTPSF